MTMIETITCDTLYSFAIAFRFTRRIAIKWYSKKMGCKWNGWRKGRKNRSESFTQDNHCVAPWYSREKLLHGLSSDWARA